MIIIGTEHTDSCSVKVGNYPLLLYTTHTHICLTLTGYAHYYSRGMMWCRKLGNCPFNQSIRDRVMRECPGVFALRHLVPLSSVDASMRTIYM